MCCLSRVMNRGSSNAPTNKSTARAIRAHPSANRDRSPVDQLRSEQPVVGSPRLDARAQVILTKIAQFFKFTAILTNFRSNFQVFV